MAENEFGFKELYSVKLKTTSPMEIDGRSFEENETLVYLDTVQLSGTTELVRRVTANGGFDNRAQVFWETTQAADIFLTRGIFSKINFALLSNSKLIQVPSDMWLSLPMYEKVESNDNGIITFSHTPLSTSMFVYNLSTGERITELIKVDDTHYKISQSYLDVILDYYYEYDNGGSVMTVGKRQVEGFLRLEGKTKFKDDVTGYVRTGIIVFPKLKLTSDLSLRLGDKSTPVINRLTATAIPVGPRNNSRVMEMYFLNDEIDDEED